MVDFPIKNGDFPVRYVSHYQSRYPCKKSYHQDPRMRWARLQHALHQVADLGFKIRQRFLNTSDTKTRCQRGARLDERRAIKDAPWMEQMILIDQYIIVKNQYKAI